jgi:hypothetical protein
MGAGGQYRAGVVGQFTPVPGEERIPDRRDGGDESSMAYLFVIVSEERVHGTVENGM